MHKIGLKFIEKAGEIFKRNKYLVLMLLVGFVLILLPGNNEKKVSEISDSFLTENKFSVNETEEKLEDILNKIDGAGKVSVMLSVDGSTERVVAEDKSIKSEFSDVREDVSEESETVVIDLGSKESVVELRYIFPHYTGAVIVAEGADDPRVKLNILNAVSSVTDLGTDRIAVVKMANN